MFEMFRKNYKRFISYNDFISVYGGGGREIKTPVEERYPPHACGLEYTKITGKILDKTLGRNARDYLDRRVNKNV
jgi:hypothetical protein